MSPYLLSRMLPLKMLHIDDQNLKKVYPKLSSTDAELLFGEYLFEPCDEHENVIGNLLSNARNRCSKCSYIR